MSCTGTLRAHVCVVGARVGCAWALCVCGGRFVFSLVVVLVYRVYGLVLQPFYFGFLFSGVGA